MKRKTRFINNSASLVQSTSSLTDPLVSQVPLTKDSVSQPTRCKDQSMRELLVIWMAILTFLLLGVYVFTKDVRVLLSGTVFAVAVYYVYAYYFRR